jgi:GNAT superfamily N-acetyltransferase
MPELTYRVATAADLSFMVALIAADDVSGATADEWSLSTAPQYEQALAAITADPNQALYVAELDGAPIGTLQLTFIPGIMRQGMWRGLVESVHIAPDHRNKGYGSAMMRWAIERCRERGCGMVQLTSNKKRVDAHRFYQALGFSQSHEGFKLFL